MKTFKLKSGTEVPLTQLKGRDYLMVAHRLVWLNEEHANFDITTEFLQLTDQQAIVKATIKLMDDSGRVIKSVTATKRETQKDFPDFHEKCETGAIGRALALCGMGTQFCQQDLDEGQRLADAPLVPIERTVPKTKPVAVVTSEPVTEQAPVDEVPKKERISSFRRDRKPTVEASTGEEPKTAPATPGGWR